MKHKSKIILTICILIIIFLIILTFYFLKKVETHTFTIVDINNKNIVTATKSDFIYNGNLDEIILKDKNLNIIEDNSKLEIGQEVYLFNEEKNTNYKFKISKIDNNNIELKWEGLKYYLFYINDTKIKDINNRNIDISNLKIGDTIKIISFVPEISNALAYSYEGYGAEKIENVKYIKVVKQNEEEVESIENRNMLAIKESAIVNVDSDNIKIEDNDSKNNVKEIINVKYPKGKTKNDFKEGEKIRIYFNGTVDLPTKTIENVGKIEKME